MRITSWATALLAVAMVSVAFLRNRALTQNLEWPAFDAQYREVAAAQTLLDSGYGPDSSYKGEKLWYNPLTSVFVAVVARVQGTPLHALVPQMGPFVTVIAPLAFLALMLTIAERSAALAGTAAFLFVWSSIFRHVEAPGYQPWLLPSHVAQGFFYIGVAAAVRVWSDPRASWWRHAGLGFLLGTTFLVHTAPAVLLGAVVTVLCGADIRWHRRVLPSLARLLATLAAAVVTSLPFLYPIASKYSFHIIHLDPAVGVYSRLDPNELPGFLLDHLRIAVLLGLAGGLRHAWRRRADPAGKALITWLLACLGFMAYAGFRVLGGKAGLVLPALVPSWHFVFYFHAWLAVGLGLGLTDLGRWVSSRVRSDYRTLAKRSTIGLATAALVALHLPGYLRNGEAIHAEGLRLARALPKEAFCWIQANTRPSAVFLSTDHMSLFVVVPAGRKVLAMDRAFSSPYVSWTERDRQRDELFERLARRDRDGFGTAARTLGIDFVIWSDSVSVWTRGALGMHPPPRLTTRDIEGSGLPQVFQGDDVAIFAVRR